ncbi:MAG: response regulator [Spirochaetales bacterium]|nr:response regulator [Spirochaetales bacterium]
MRIQRRLLIGSILVYTLFVVAYAVWFNVREERILMDHIDHLLMTAAKSIKYMLEPDFHDRAVDADAISWDEIERNRKAVSDFVFESDFEYIYTLVEKDGSFFFSAPTVTPEEYLEKKNWYFHPYEDVPDGFKRALSENIPVFETYSDQWGSFRSVALPQVSPGGNRYLSCADYEISHLSASLFKNFALSVFTALLFILLTIPFIFLYRRTLEAHNLELLGVNRELKDYQDHLEQLVKQRTGELEEEKKKAEEANSMKSRFLFNVSHELRTPLNGITGYCEALRDTGDQELIRHYGEIIQREADNLLALINDLLDLAKIESGKMAISPTLFYLKDLVEDTLHGQAIQAEKKGLSFHWFMDPAVPQVLRGDRLRIRQVLLNLVSNAVKFTQAGDVSIHFDLVDKKGDMVLVRCSVVDTGIGIPRDKQEQIFESFSQADPSITRRYGGTGLGVSIARQLVELMGGDLHLESIPGAGSTFFFIIPLETCALTRDDLERLAADSMSAEENDIPGYGNVLLVDDYPTNLDILSLFLRNAGYTVETADNGAVAVDLCQTRSFDCIFMDIQMPGINGFDAVQHIRKSANSKNQETPVIALSASMDETTRERCSFSGMNGFLLKPVKKNRLLSLTAYWTGKRKGCIDEKPGRESGIGEPVREKVLNLETALSNFEDDRDMLLDALTRFSVLVREESPILNGREISSNYEDLFREAHKLKGAAALLGAEELSGITKKIEEAARERDDGKISDCLSVFQGASLRLADEVSRVNLNKSE